MLKSASKDPRSKPNALLSERIRKVREQLEKRRLNGFLVSSGPNRRYLTGWVSDPESGFVLITPKKSFIITDSRYREHAARQVSGFEIVETEEGSGPALRDLAKAEKIKSIGFESHHLDVFSFKKIKRLAKGIRLVPVVHLVEELRSLKDEVELEKIKKAASIADKTFAHILNFVKAGMTEKQVAWEIEKFIREAGGEKLAWEPVIVAARANSSMVHYGAGDTKIKKSDMVLIDFGGVYQGYCSDISRVIFVGKPDSQQIKIYNLVLAAQRYGLSLVGKGRLGATIDKKVRAFLGKSLPNQQVKNIYRHALGHGVGLEVHELPSVNIRRKAKLAVGNVLTIEPGVYIPGWGGIRIEDMVLVTDRGYQLLTKAPKDIKEVTI